MKICNNEYDRILAEYQDDTVMNWEEFIDNEVQNAEVEMMNYVTFGKVYQSLPRAGQLILLAEAINLAAKVHDYSLYYFKPLVIFAAAKEGAFLWFGEDENYNDVAYLWHNSVGTASFHGVDSIWDFPDDIKDTIGYQNWNFPWSGITRQWAAFDVLVSKELLEQFAVATRPRKTPLSAKEIALRFPLVA